MEHWISKQTAVMYLCPSFIALIAFVALIVFMALIAHVMHTVNIVGEVFSFHCKWKDGSVIKAPLHLGEY